jgi:peptidoglycan biosynthesis protein MviN/MurJ (putative lipid II flippase)
MGAVGLAVGSAVAAWIEMLFLSRKISKKITPNPSPLSPIVKLLPAVLSSVIISIIARWLLSNTNELINCLVCVPIAAFFYIFISSKSGVKESSLLLEGLKRNLKKLKFP